MLSFYSFKIVNFCCNYKIFAVACYKKMFVFIIENIQLGIVIEYYFCSFVFLKKQWRNNGIKHGKSYCGGKSLNSGSPPV